MKNIWNKIPKWVVVWGIVIFAILMVWNFVYPTGITRYKITVTIETPEGIKTGSAVREYFVQKTPEPLDTITPHTRVKGEAVVVDLGERSVVFAVMGTDDYWVLWNSFPTDAGALTIEGIKYYRSFKGEQETIALKDRPMLVTFTDIKDPKTVTPVYRVVGTPIPSSSKYTYDVDDKFEEVFGKGVALKDITIETTNEPVTWKVEEYLSEAMNNREGWQWLVNLKYDDPRRIGFERFREGK